MNNLTSKGTRKHKRNSQDANVLTFADNKILEIYNHFKTPLENAGFTGDSDDLLDMRRINKKNDTVWLNRHKYLDKL